MKKPAAGFLFLVLLVALPTQAKDRVALVIGNGAYADAPLRNPTNDAMDMAATLEALDFEVIQHTNLDRVDMHKAIREFGNALKGAQVGLFYYAGHGIQVGGRNYLIPVGADIVAEDEVEFQAIEADRVLAKMESADNPVNIVILDSCRDNPLARSFRSTTRGLAQMDAPTGSLVLYATAPGRTAADGTGRNGTFTGELMNQLQTPGLTLQDVVLNTRVAVMSATGDQQVPWSSSSLTRRVVLTPREPSSRESAGSPPPRPVSGSARKSETASQGSADRPATGEEVDIQEVAAARPSAYQVPLRLVQQSGGQCVLWGCVATIEIFIDSTKAFETVRRLDLPLDQVVWRGELARGDHDIHISVHYKGKRREDFRGRLQTQSSERLTVYVAHVGRLTSGHFHPEIEVFYGGKELVNAAVPDSESNEDVSPSSARTPRP